MAGVEKSYKDVISQDKLNMLLDLISQVKFGSITIVIQDGKVVQIEKNEKLRLV